LAPREAGPTVRIDSEREEPGNQHYGDHQDDCGERRADTDKVEQRVLTGLDDQGSIRHTLTFDI